MAQSPGLRRFAMRLLLVLLLLLLLGATACGTKGPLYLPPSEPADGPAAKSKR